MNKDEIEKAVKEAEQFAAEMEAKREAVDAQRLTNWFIKPKTMTELGDKVPADEKTAITAKLDALKEALKSDDMAKIKKSKKICKKTCMP